MTNKRSKTQLVVRGAQLIAGALRASLLLLLEAPVRPIWFAYRLRGYLDRYVLNGYHKSRVAEYEAHTRSYYEAISYVTQRDERRIRSINGDGHDGGAGALESFENDGQSPIPGRYDGTPELTSTIYLFCKLLKPAVVIETGVARGVTSRTILNALQENGTGHLYSVELPALLWGYRAHVGEMVPEDLRDRWSLRFGPSRRVLSGLLQDLGQIDIFIHDAAHSYHPQKAEYELALAHLSPAGILISDDVSNDAFVEVAEDHGCRWSIIQQPKANPIGLLVKSP